MEKIIALKNKIALKNFLAIKKYQQNTGFGSFIKSKVRVGGNEHANKISDALVLLKHIGYYFL